MSTFYETPLRSDELYHYGRKGMKWYQHIFGKDPAVKSYKREQSAKIKEGKAKLAMTKVSGRNSIYSAKEARNTARENLRSAKSQVKSDVGQILRGKNVKETNLKADFKVARQASRDYDNSKYELRKTKAQNKKDISQLKTEIKTATKNKKNAAKIIGEKKTNESDPKWLYENRSKFTTEQLNERIKRIEAENKVYKLSLEKAQRGKKAADTVIGYGQSVSKAFETMQKINDNWDTWDGTLIGIDILGKRKHKHSRYTKESDYRKSKDNS